MKTVEIQIRRNAVQEEAASANRFVSRIADLFPGLQESRKASLQKVPPCELSCFQDCGDPKKLCSKKRPLQTEPFPGLFAEERYIEVFHIDRI